MEIKTTQFTEEIPVLSEDSNVKESVPKNPPTTAEILTWLVSYLVELWEIEPDEVDVTVPFDRYGLDSSAALSLTGDLQDWLGSELEPMLLYNYPTIEALSQHLAQKS